MYWCKVINLKDHIPYTVHPIPFIHDKPSVIPIRENFFFKSRISFTSP